MNAQAAAAALRLRANDSPESITPSDLEGISDAEKIEILWIVNKALGDEVVFLQSKGR